MKQTVEAQDFEQRKACANIITANGYRSELPHVVGLTVAEGQANLDSLSLTESEVEALMYLDAEQSAQRALGEMYE